MSLSRLRQTAGNICLVLFLAFLFSGFWGGVSSAYAAEITPIQAPVNQDGSPTDKGSISNDKLSFNFVVASDINFKNVWADIYGNGNVITQVYFDNADAVQKVSSTYGQVYAFTYSFAQSVGNPYVNIRSVYNDTMETVYFSQGVGKPPQTDPGGGSSSAPAETVKTEETDIGTIFTDPDGSVTVSLSTTKVEAQLTANPDMTTVVVEMPVDAAGQTALQLPSGLVDALSSSGKELVIRQGDVDFTIPASALQVAEVAEQVAAGKDVQVRLSISELPAEAATTAFNELTDQAKEGRTFLGRVYQFEAAVLADGEAVSGIDRFNSPLTLAMAYEDNDVEGVEEGLLNVYQLVDGEAVYVGGKVDEDNNQVIARLSHFSNYAIMAYSKTFADLAEHWSKQDVDLMISKHVVTGYPDDTFKPDANITRAEFAALLVRALGLEVSQVEATFSDVNAEAWYAGPVETAKAAGLLSGYPDGTFKPNQTINRQEMAAMVASALSAAGYQSDITEAEISTALSKFVDGDQVAPWARSGAALAVSAGIVNGRGADDFAPKGLATRAEAAVMLKRLMVQADYL